MATDRSAKDGGLRGFSAVQSASASDPVRTGQTLADWLKAATPIGAPCLQFADLPPLPITQPRIDVSRPYWADSLRGPSGDLLSSQAVDQIRWDLIDVRDTGVPHVYGRRHYIDAALHRQQPMQYPSDVRARLARFACEQPIRDDGLPGYWPTAMPVCSQEERDVALNESKRGRLVRAVLTTIRADVVGARHRVNRPWAYYDKSHQRLYLVDDPGQSRISEELWHGRQTLYHLGVFPWSEAEDDRDGWYPGRLGAC